MKNLIFGLALCAAALLNACDDGDDLYIRPSTYTISAPAEQSTSTFTVESSVDWKLSVPDTDEGVVIGWISSDVTTGRAGDRVTVTLTIEASITDRRTATVLLSGDGASARITVSQTAAVEGTLTGETETNYAYTDISFVPLTNNTITVHKLLMVTENGEREIVATGNAGTRIFEVNAPAWGSYTYVYQAGYMEGGIGDGDGDDEEDDEYEDDGEDGDGEDGDHGDDGEDGEFVAVETGESITIRFTRPEGAAVLEIDEENATPISARLTITAPLENIDRYQVFRDGEEVSGKVMILDEYNRGSTDVSSEGSYTVSAILSRVGAPTAVYGEESNEVEVWISTTPPPPIGK